MLESGVSLVDVATSGWMVFNQARLWGICSGQGRVEDHLDQRYELNVSKERGVCHCRRKPRLEGGVESVLGDLGDTSQMGGLWEVGNRKTDQAEEIGC